MSKSLLKVIHQAKENKMSFHGIHVRHISSIYLLSIAVAILFVMTFPGSLPAAVKQKSFGSAEEAVQAFISAGRNNDDKELSNYPRLLAFRNMKMIQRMILLAILTNLHYILKVRSIITTGFYSPAWIEFNPSCF